MGLVKIQVEIVPLASTLPKVGKDCTRGKGFMSSKMRILAVISDIKEHTLTSHLWGSKI